MEEKNVQYQILEDIALSLRELVKLSRVVSHPKVKEFLMATLNSKEKLSVYNSMDGEKTVSAIQELTGVNSRFISEWGQEWEQLGIVEINSTLNIRGRRQKIFDLTLYNISAENISYEES